MQLLSILNFVGLVYGVGAATFAMIFYFKALEDGVLDTSEKNFMHSVYFILRIAMTIVILSELIIIIVSWYSGSTEYFFSSTLWFRVILLMVINSSAIFMDNRLLPMWIGVVSIAVTWYAYFLMMITKPESVSFLGFFLLYVVALGVSMYAFKSLRNLYLKRLKIKE
jgi:hypothetical protein